MNHKATWAAIAAGCLLSLGAMPGRAAGTDAFWRNATVYFLMTDRFANGEPGNDGAYGRVADGDPLRSFTGGDLRGVIQKLDEGYFRDLGVTAIWTTPVIQQVRQPHLEYGRSYAFHGYWPKDWTAVDEAFGTEADFAEMVRRAHEQGIRVLVDVIINHAGPPIGGDDPAWPSDWVRTEPTCDYQSFAGTATCLIVPALQDIRTESDAAVDLPPFLVEKWRAEGRLDQEVAELDAFFARTGYPRAPRYYVIKWLTDWVREYGVDGFRVDTAKHVEPAVWAALKAEAELAQAEWKANHPGALGDDQDFYMVGEVFNFGLANFQKSVGRAYDFGDQHVDFFDHGFDALINMGFPTHAQAPMPELFDRYAGEFATTFSGRGMLNYISSHDDMEPLDPERNDPFDNATKLMLAPGAVQIYYGDELSRRLVAEGTTGDARLRTSMDWTVHQTPEGQAILDHWQRLGQFRQRHPAVGAGEHRELSSSPYVFSRVLNEDGVEDRMIAAHAPATPFIQVPSGGVFPDETTVRDAYAGDLCQVSNGWIHCPSERALSLFEAIDVP
jgi:alpha-amylase